MTGPIIVMELRLRLRSTAFAAIGLIVLTAAVGALFPAFGGSIGTVALPPELSQLLGGDSFASITGWLQTEVVSVYGPLVFAAVAISSAVGAVAGEEEDGILALVLAQPVTRTRLLLGKAAAIAALLVVLAGAVFLGLVLAVVFAGGGIGVANLAAVALHLLFLGLSVAGLALALSAGTGRRGSSAGTSAAVVLVMFLLNGLVPASPGVAWVRYLTLFHYYEGQDQIRTGIHPGGLAVLAVVTIGLTAAAVASFRSRDLGR